jgi:hypothetical protein
MVEACPPVHPMPRSRRKKGRESRSLSVSVSLLTACATSGPSKRCAGAHRTAAANAAKVNAAAENGARRREQGVPERPAELIDASAVQALTPAQSAKVRAYVFGVLRVQLPCATVSSWARSSGAPRVPRLRRPARQMPSRYAANLVEREREHGDLRVISQSDPEALAVACSEPPKPASGAPDWPAP